MTAWYSCINQKLVLRDLWAGLYCMDAHICWHHCKVKTIHTVYGNPISLIDDRRKCRAQGMMGWLRINTMLFERCLFTLSLPIILWARYFRRLAISPIDQLHKINYFNCFNFTKIQTIFKNKDGLPESFPLQNISSTQPHIGNYLLYIKIQTIFENKNGLSESAV